MAEELKKPKGADKNFLCEECGCFTLNKGKCLNTHCPLKKDEEDDDQHCHFGHA